MNYLTTAIAADAILDTTASLNTSTDAETHVSFLEAMPNGLQDLSSPMTETTLGYSPPELKIKSELSDALISPVNTSTLSEATHDLVSREMDIKYELAGSLMSGGPTKPELPLDLSPRDADVKPESPVTPTSPNVDTSISSSASSSSSSDSESETDSEEEILAELGLTLEDNDDGDENFPVFSSVAYLTTKNEVVEQEIVVPDIPRVGADEQLEKVGEIMSIVDDTVIIKGRPSNRVGKGAESALDSDTLLVLEDRTVLGYIYETFGPTTQPLYQIKFNHKYPMDKERARVSREVFHVPQRSRFVFVDQIKAQKGSDASNVYDEEPAEDEVEYSDDDEEALYKSRKRKRGHAGASSSSVSDLTPAEMTDQDFADVYTGSGAYDAHGLYDIDFTAQAASRPPPIPYDDPYSECVPLDAKVEPVRDAPRSPTAPTLPALNRGNGRGRGRGQERDQRRGRGRGRGGNDNGRSRGGRGSVRGRDDYSVRDRSRSVHREGYSSPTGMSPQASHFTNSFSSRAALTPNFNPQLQAYQPQHPAPNIPDWSSFQHMQPPFYPQSYQQNFVQPHINPLFASAFMNVGYGMPAQQPSTNGSTAGNHLPGSSWSNTSGYYSTDSSHPSTSNADPGAP